jgi:hypothetical protein
LLAQAIMEMNPPRLGASRATAQSDRALPKKHRTQSTEPNMHNLAIIETRAPAGDPYRKPGTFLRGNPGGPAGRKKGKAAQLFAKAHQLSDQHGLECSDPAEMLMIIAMVGRDPLEKQLKPKLGEESLFAKSKLWPYLELEDRIDAARLLLPFMYSKLQAVEVSGEDGEPLFAVQAETARQLSRDPDIRRLFETIAIKAASLQVTTE